MNVENNGRYLRACAVCGEPVPVRAYQANSARTCKPVCAKRLAVQEHPDIDKVRARGTAQEPNGHG